MRLAMATCTTAVRAAAARAAMPLRTARRGMTGTTWGHGTRALQVVDCHAAGEPARVVMGGVPTVHGETMYEKRQYFMDHLDHIRKLLLLEPRGYPCQNADVLVPPVDPRADYGFLILEQNKIYPAMSGHNTICVATALLETGMVPIPALGDDGTAVAEFTLEAPGGLIDIRARCRHGKAEMITLRNVPAFVPPSHAGGVTVEVPDGVGPVRVDVAFGGMWYAVVEAADVGLTLDPARGKEIVRLGEMIKVATREQHPVNHPEFDYPGTDILVFRGPPASPGAHAQNAVVMSNNELDWDRPETWTGMIDRSPCGTGTCAVMAVMHARGELGLGEDFVHESIVGTTFTGRLVAETTIDGMPAVVPEVSGQGWVTQHCTVVCDPSDPFPEGYTVGDIW